MSRQQKRQAVVFPKEQKILNQLGENIRLALKRRKITQTMLAERTGISKPTLRNITRGEPSVSIGHYLRVLAVLGLAEDLSKVALDDEMGRKLQDIELLKDTHEAKAKNSVVIDTLMLEADAVQKQKYKATAKRVSDQLLSIASQQASTPSDRLNKIFAQAKARSVQHSDDGDSE